MCKSKTFSYTYEDYEDNHKTAETMVADILADSELDSLEEIIIGSWGDCWDGGGAARIIEDIVANKESFSHIKSLFVGDMDYEECEVSWIIQGNYEPLYSALPQLEKLTIKGSTDLDLGKVSHKNLKSLEIICGGLPKSVLESIKNADLPSLERLVLYLGVENYGFDGDISDVEALLRDSDFPKLKILGIVDSEIQDQVVKAVLESKYMPQLEQAEFSMGSLTDEGSQLLCDKIPEFPGMKSLDLHYHYLSDEMMEKLKKLPLEVHVEDQNQPDEYGGEIYRDPLLTE